MEEKWKVIAEFPQYSVSTLGRVQSRRTATPKIVQGTITSMGYTAHIFRSESSRKPRRRMLHRLVAEAFIHKESDDQTDVCHCDGNPRNNEFSNLRWDTHRQNQMDMRKHGTMQDGEKCNTVKITEPQMNEIRERANSEGRGSGRRLAKEFGLSVAQISRIKNGKRWTAFIGENS